MRLPTRKWLRRSGAWPSRFRDFDHFVELDIVVDGSMTVHEGHDLAHQVQEAIKDAIPVITRVMVHVEPQDAYGRYKLDWEK